MEQKTPQNIIKRSLHAWIMPYDSVVSQLQRVASTPEEVPEHKGIINMSSSILECLKQEFWGYESTYDVRSVLSFFGDDVLIKYLQNPKEKSAIEEMTYRLSLYHTFFGLTSGVEIFDEVDFAGVFIGAPVEHSNGEIAHTFGQAIMGDNTRLYGNAFLYTMGAEEKRLSEYEWDQAFFRALSLHLLWNMVPYVSTEDVEDMIEFHIYESILVGVSVADILKKYILESYDIMDFAIRSGIVMQSLENNKEKIPVTLGSATHMTLIGIVGAFKDKHGEAIDPLKMQTFIKDLYKEGEMAEQFRLWLRDVMYVYFHTIDGYFYKEFDKKRNVKTPKDIHDNELMRLIQAFFSLEAGWNDIASYYASKTVVSLSTFLDTLAKYYKPNSEVRIQKLLEFNEFLHGHNMIGEDVSLIEFDEEKDTMEWSFDW